MASVLSPLAPPFYPMAYYEPVSLFIYNDGMPTLVVHEGEETKLLHGISDEALDEAFPPDAEDAAEMEEVENFVNLMATLSLLEEHEEAARTIHAGLKKRWEARRELLGRPRPPMHLVHSVTHGDHRLAESRELVIFDQAHKLVEHRMRARESSRSFKPNALKNPGFGNRVKPIQQPRK